MKRLVYSLLASAFFVSASSAQALSLWGGCLDVDVQSGWRQDNLNFNVSGPDGSPDTASERRWKDLRSYDSFLRVDYDWCNILLRGYGNYGKIYAGYSRTKAWSGDDRTNLINDQKSEADRGEVFDYGVALGYRLPWCYCDQHFVLTPLLGWSQHEQHLRQTHGEDLVGAGAGPIRDMHNNYQTRWYGPWLGYDLSYCLPYNFTLTQTFQYHWARYRATGHDHERDSGDANAVRGKYRHRDHGHGFQVGGGLEYAIDDTWSLAVNSYYMSMRCRNGKESSTSTLPVAGSSTATLNDVRWRNWVVRAAIDYNF